jgi:protein arginine kinase activator
MARVICQLCAQRPATAHLIEVDASDGSLREVHLCNHCRKDLGSDLRENPPPVAEILAQAPDPETAAGAELATALTGDETGETPTPCPTCGLTWQDFASNNRFGCAACAQAFAVRLDPAFTEIHGANQHVGRLPAESPNDARERLMAHRLHLEQSLAKAVAEEAFERAARLRDQLRRLDEGAA